MNENGAGDAEGAWLHQRDGRYVVSLCISSTKVSRTRGYHPVGGTRSEPPLGADAGS